MRIIAGIAKGRRIKAPKGNTTRPTPDRVREALFSILSTHVVDARVLDLFAGTGAFGIEALSRGAKSATFVESERATARLVLDNSRIFTPNEVASDAVVVLTSDAFRALA